MNDIFWTETAADDRDRALVFIAQTNLDPALEQSDEIDRQTERLLRFPGLGRPSRRKGLRDLPINRTRFVASIAQ